jgi:hypothetical protein
MCQLRIDSEPALDKLCLSYRITSIQSFHLSFRFKASAQTLLFGCKVAIMLSARTQTRVHG